MKIKKGASLSGIDIRLRPALVAADASFKLIECDFVITSGLDGAHSAGSLHYYGLAFDCRTRHIPNGLVQTVVKEIKTSFPNVFDVVLEINHIHIEYDPNKE